jgi:ribulose 1,5-bisphosphate carboxylase large subunit-like protein
MCDRHEEHFDADQKVLQPDCQLLGAPTAQHIAVDDIKVLQHRNRNALPERQEDHGFDAQELWHRLEGFEFRGGGLVEQHQKVHGQRDRHVVDDDNVHVAFGR